MEKEQKIIIIKFAVFCLIVVTGIFIINFIYLKYVFTKTIVMQAETEYLSYISNSSNKNIDYAFFGTSHTRGSINPDYISPKAYNFASPGESQAMMYLKLKHMLDYDNVTIKNAVFEIDMQTFSSSFSALGYANYALKFAPLSEIRKIKKEDSLIKILLEIYLPVLGNGEDLKILFVNDFKRAAKQNKGSLMFTGDFTKEDMNLSLKGVYVTNFANSKRIDDMNMEYFLKILKLAKSKDIGIIFIKYPVSKEYNQYLQQKNVTRDDYYSEILSGVNLTISGNYALLDYHDYFNDSSLFYDSDHLNVKGAELFSEKVHFDLKQLNFSI